MVHKLRMVFVFFNNYISTYIISLCLSPGLQNLKYLLSFIENVFRPLLYMNAATVGREQKE